MKTSQKFFANRSEIEIWFEDVNGATYFWKKEDGISYSITEKQYLNLVFKHDLLNLLTAQL